MNRILAIITIVLLIAHVAPAKADETVVVRTSRGDQARLTGEIVDFDSQRLLLKLPDGRQRTVAAEDVLKIETPYTNEQLQADRAVAKGNSAAALPLYQRALSLEQRRWVRRKILREMIWCHRALGQVEQAGELFLLLARDGLGTADLACTPLAWSAGMPSATLERASRRWMARDDLPAAVLLGSSRLLSTDRAAAAARLKQLAVKADGPVAQLAAAQLWRTDIVTARAAQTDAWQRAIKSMPEAIQIGPYFVLGEALFRQGRLDEAALAMLRAPILHPRNAELAATALMASGRALEKLHREPQAARMYREVIQQYGTSPEATEARSRLDTLTQK